MNAVLNYTGSVAVVFPMGIDMDLIGGSKWHLGRCFCNYRVFWLRWDTFYYPKSRIPIAGGHFLSKTATLGNRHPLQPLGCFNL